MKYVYTVVVLFVILIQGACLDDKTNLNYSEILLPDSVLVTNLATDRTLRYDPDQTVGVYSLEPNQELQLDVEVFYRGTDNITCEWYFDGKLIETGMQLRHSFEKEGAGMLFVYREKAGNAVGYQFYVKIQKPFGAGVFVLGKNNGKIRLDFVQSTNATSRVEFNGNPYNLTLYNFVEREDVYTTLNNGASLNMVNPVKLFKYRGYNWDLGIMWGLQLLDQTWQNSVTVNMDNMAKLTEMKDEFVVAPQNFQAVDFMSYGAMSFVLNKSGEIYSRVNYDYGNPCTGRYSSAPLSYNDPYDVPDKGAEVIKATGLYPHAIDPVALIYEKEKKRFLAISTVNSAYDSWPLEYCYLVDFSRPVNMGSLPEGYINLNDLNKELVTVLSSKTDYGYYYFLFKDATHYYLQTCYLDVMTWDMPFQVNTTIISCVTLPVEIGQILATGNNCFEFSENKEIYFTSGNTLYSIKTSTNEWSKVFEFPQKDRITKFCIMRPWKEGADSPMDRYYNGRVFGAVFDNGDFKVVKLYDDPDKPGETPYTLWVDKHYDGGVFDILYYPYLE